MLASWFVTYSVCLIDKGRFYKLYIINVFYDQLFQMLFVRFLLVFLLQAIIGKNLFVHFLYKICCKNFLRGIF